MEQFDFAIQVMLLGFSVVLFTLFALYLILLLFNRIFYKKEDKPRPAVTSRPAQATKRTKNGLDQRTAAAIMAAVYCCMQLEGSSSPGARISIAVQPSGKTSASSWQMVARRSLLENKVELENTRRKKRREKI